MDPTLPALWAGIECTMNRVGDVYRDQCRLSGHAERVSDLAVFRAMGIERIRYPFLWEKAYADENRFDWRWHDERMRELERLALKPVAGLLHHGSGPPHTDLLDPLFPEKFAGYAAAFAERYPWVEDYTPINEPLTTARFSCLYGFWYPHAASDAAFARALYHQVRATILAMREIRRLRPNARLIQTEDLGRATGTPLLQHQVDFENNRRWLTFDLLCGKVDRRHALYSYLRQSGLGEAELRWLEENACPPSVCGLNHYLLSNRFLDEELHHYPPGFHGGNGRHRYADVGAVDSPRAPATSPKEIFREAAERYRLPIAVTEAHIHGFRESQLRWCQEIWRAAVELRAAGHAVEAVTFWSLLGSHDWNSLCRAENGFYETGVFDTRAPEPRPTALARMLKGLACEGEFSHPLLGQSGYWRRDGRRSGRPILITGAGGKLAAAFGRACVDRNIPFVALGRDRLDIASANEVTAAIEGYAPWAVVNAAGFAKVRLAESESEKCFRENFFGAKILAEATGREKIPLLAFSTHMVFDGKGREPYLEDHAVGPVNVYGRSKALSEGAILAANPYALVVRTGALFDPWSQENFITSLLARLTKGESVRIAEDVTISPTYTPDLVHACLDLLIDGESGLLHLANRGKISLADFGEIASGAAPLAQRTGAPTGRIERCRFEEIMPSVPRPRFSALASSRFTILGGVEQAIERFFFEQQRIIRREAA